MDLVFYTLYVNKILHLNTETKIHKKLHMLFLKDNSEITRNIYRFCNS